MNELFGKYIVGRKVIGIKTDEDIVEIEVQGEGGDTFVVRAELKFWESDDRTFIDTTVARKKVVYERLVK